MSRDEPRSGGGRREGAERSSRAREFDGDCVAEVGVYQKLNREEGDEQRRTEIGRRKKRRSREELKSSGVRWRLRGRGGVSSAMAKAMAESGEGKGVVSLASSGWGWG
ncbi:hypothetical protein Sjap_014331 [Stephania japonica]|uniref:Uncharacterized protein n=1 Tax=Stephania japonica TaxID=461633 RepID=A0AAP0IZL9_9MAGN